MFPFSSACVRFCSKCIYGERVHIRMKNEGENVDECLSFIIKVGMNEVSLCESS
jgi:hypothetical protein